MEDCKPWETTVEQLYKEMYPALYIYALRVLEEAALAEESIQDTFCIACAKREQFLSSTDPKRWIMCTLKYVCQNTLRTQAKWRKLLLSLDAGGHLTSKTPELMSVDVLFCDLSGSEDFQLLKRIALDRCTVLEMAEELGISVESCKKRVQRARKRLQEKLEVCI
ncbi:RNA polymerase sigma factor [uncultured Oscillibacter sp.]|jgi:RNA polymerase sigma-70 factor (ECF subfamily)|uniref:RNA polymerase sigma factor n=1 Tax=uncultured Oscillibacter sp. TaxID=876091 RepID=UPI0025EE70A2|nr:sigma-70 family RNA polymerase sigma factor [uncultured Oscillibacter sp.]